MGVVAAVGSVVMGVGVEVSLLLSSLLLVVGVTVVVNVGIDTKVGVVAAVGSMMMGCGVAVPSGVEFGT